jgi:hypothetical protein
MAVTSCGQASKRKLQQTGTGKQTPLLVGWKGEWEYTNIDHNSVVQHTLPLL